MPFNIINGLQAMLNLIIKVKNFFWSIGMKILGREFITEQMPHGWVICERHIDGALNVVADNLSNKREANKKLQCLNDSLTTDCQQMGISPEQYWHRHDRKT